MSKETILIIDKDTDFIRAIESVLRDNDIRVSTVESTTDAFRKLREQQVNLAIVDFRSLGICGIESLQELTNISSDLITIVLVEHIKSSNMLTFKEIRDAGAFICLEKPIDPMCLLDVIHLGLAKKQLEQENLRLKPEIDSLSTEILANVSHELRAPLSAIKGYSTALLQPDVIFDRETTREFLQTIDQEADKLERIISDLLTMSRLDSEQPTGEEKVSNLTDIIDGIKDNLYNLTKKHNLKINIQENLHPVVVDDRISEVFINLVENAVKYSPEGTSVIVEVKLNPGNVLVSVIDEGTGIAPEYHNKIFDRFYRITDRLSGRKSGTGLGLFISKSIIETYGGNMWVESEPGKGSKFCFTLPCLLEK